MNHYLIQTIMDRYELTFKSWDKIAAEYNKLFTGLDLYDDTYDAFCDKIKGNKIFEIGCGPGNITQYLLKKRPDFSIDATDVAPNMLKLAKENNPTVNFRIMDCRELNTITDKYNGIMCGFTLPYLSDTDTEKLVADSFTLLENEGVLYISAIEGDDRESGFQTGSTGDKVYLYYHSEIRLKEILHTNSFKITHTFRKTYQRKNGITEIHLLLIAVKTI